MQEIVHYNAMRVMAARARARVPVCEAHALMKRIHITCNGNYTENLLGSSEAETSSKSSLAYIDSYFS